MNGVGNGEKRNGKRGMRYVNNNLNFCGLDLYAPEAERCST